MKSSKLDQALAVLETGSHPGHKRHQTHRHHWSATALVIAVSLGLVVLLVVTVGQQTSSPSFKAPSGSLSTEAATTLSGVSSDFQQVTAADLPASLAAPTPTSSAQNLHQAE